LEERVAPLKLSREFCEREDCYDNSGIIIDCGVKINGVLFSLDLSPDAVIECEDKGFNCIVTHHPAIFGGVSKLIKIASPNQDAIMECIQKGISVISMHLNFDAAPEGIDYYLMKGVGGNKAETMINLSCGAYGRVYDIEKVTLKNLVERIKKEFNTQRVIYYGDDDKVIKKAASFCGAGCDESAIAFCVKNGADLILSSDMKHHHIAELVSRGIAIITLTHYSSEVYGFNKIYQKLIDKLNVPSCFYCDGRLI
jgi:dinuclear metal center YbgI/SA1388 family protein